MKVCTVREVVSVINEIAPFELAEEWDNVGLLQGSQCAEVRNILVALDITDAVAEEAKEKDCQLIVTHHPFMFKPIHRLTDETREGRLMLKLAAFGIAHIAAHTNLDAAPGGVLLSLASFSGAEEENAFCSSAVGASVSDAMVRLQQRSLEGPLFCGHLQQFFAAVRHRLFCGHPDSRAGIYRNSTWSSRAQC